MPALTVYNASQLGSSVAWTTLAAATTYEFDNTERTVLFIRNPVTASVATDNVVTITTPATVAGLAVADQTVSIDVIGAAATTKAIGKLPRSAFNSGSKVTFTAVGTDVASLEALVVEP